MKRYYVDPQSMRQHYTSYRLSWTDKVYMAIKDSGANGLTAREAAVKAGLADPTRVHSYISQLRKLGHIGHVPEPGAITSNMSPRDAALASLLTLEQALAIRARAGQTTPEMEKQFIVYQKLKEHAIRSSGNEHESYNALKMAVITLVKLVF